ncbi:MAG: dihydroorotate dehydrogenase [Chlorobi bacterium]|nr:MAG: dihydroorotate dehydrogenase, catalytic subunit [Chlorobi bacterium OLB7]MBK8912615.1 dihydroorotate dehydrogenase [Chlorobiota bacterium]MBX7217826.1 dihydroorotate dehydrogenase [Candidatus Kapabacteria bacterium]
MTELQIRNVRFKNPVLTASGTFGYGLECPDLFDVAQLGGVVTKSISRKPRDGNPPQRIAETSSGGMLNSIGLANVGVDVFLDQKLPALLQRGATVIVNIAASSVEEYCYVLERCESHEGIAGYEINVSCPNVKDGGLSFGTNCPAVAQITRELRRRTDRFLAMKLTPNVTSIGEFARACEAEGADAVSCVNTFLGMDIDIRTRRPKIATITGGYSGPAILPMALAKVHEVRKAVKIPIIGIGGIMTAEDALKFLVVGASLVQLGTVLFVDPMAATTVVKGIEDYMTENGFKAINDLIGSLDVTMQPSLVAAGWS